MTAPVDLTPVADRLGKLLLMLSSNHDGEIVAAARAIDRALTNADLSWHDLSAALTAPRPRPAPPSPPPRSAPRSHTYSYTYAANSRPRWPSSGTRDWREAARHCLAHFDRDRFNDREREFLDEMVWLAEEYSGKRPSERQLNWLAGLYARAVRRGP